LIGVPRARRESGNRSKEGDMARPRPDPATALVIDDEAPIRHRVHRMLEPEVCRVLEAPDAETGLRIIEVDDPRIDIVLSDWIMPGLDGLDVIEVLQQHRPGIPVAVISAYTATLYPVIGDGSRYRMLQKPFTAEQIQESVSEMVSSARRLRDSARELSEWAARARDANASLREQNTALRERMDLVEAAWALHHARAGGALKVPGLAVPGSGLTSR
jgi:DNA-binding NtrC family response regulator